ncbi:hypothetical protein C8A00DRAFT_33808 [Chaetomidium leptoderma]|uniref:Uncharacterized protein n=1 Tax=Chaetomidium leptoderma TaxID=669021 RepID=A0AAN6VLF5_9PEZI|nr:hypothetical protein C8A00DRAFT_33808 [Chaetomidium leptoderma]
MGARIVDLGAAHETLSNDEQSVEYQLLEWKIQGNAIPMGNLLEADTQSELDNLSTIAHRDVDSDANEFASSAAASECAAADSSSESGSDLSDKEDNNGHAQTIPDADEAEVISDEDENDDGTPTAHIPNVDNADIYNPDVNPAAPYWVKLPAFSPATVPPVDETDGANDRAHKEGISMYNPPLPAFDTDPFLPFAPWRVNQLPPFQPESTNRVLPVPRCYLAAVGNLYPDSTFLVSRHPASANFTTRIKGSALAQSVALHHPTLVDPASLIANNHHSKTKKNNNNKTKEDDLYILVLYQRDWPVGTVAFFPNTADAKAFLAVLVNSFGRLPQTQEVFYHVPCDVADNKSNSNNKNNKNNKNNNRNSNAIMGGGMWVCRAYEGRRGPQDERLVREWVEQVSPRGLVEQDLVGREVLVRMGEAYVEPEKWPKKNLKGGGGY